MTVAGLSLPQSHLRAVVGVLAGRAGCPIGHRDGRVLGGHDAKVLRSGLYVDRPGDDLETLFPAGGRGSSEGEDAGCGRGVWKGDFDTYYGQRPYVFYPMCGGFTISLSQRDQKDDL